MNNQVRVEFELPSIFSSCCKIILRFYTFKQSAYQSVFTQTHFFLSSLQPILNTEISTLRSYQITYSFLFQQSLIYSLKLLILISTKSKTYELLHNPFEGRQDKQVLNIASFPFQLQTCRNSNIE